MRVKGTEAESFLRKKKPSPDLDVNKIITLIFISN